MKTVFGENIDTRSRTSFLLLDWCVVPIMPIASSSWVHVHIVLHLISPHRITSHHITYALTLVSAVNNKN
jgi:hypothetical protein